MKIKDAEQTLNWNKIRNNVGIGQPSEGSENVEGRLIVQFVEDMTEFIEKYLAEFSPEGEFDRLVLNRALAKANVEYLELHEIGQALVFIGAFWYYADQLVALLTPIEYKMYVEALAGMIAAQQLEAQDVEPPQKKVV
jgi:hypothetical protein